MKKEQTQMISVIVPVYNVEKYLPECLESILKQTYENMEILAVDDGSTDSSTDILEQASEKDARIHVLRKENGGLSDARNYALDRAKGEYVAFIDGDDTIHSEMMQKMLEGCISRQADIAVCDMEYHFDDGTKKFSSGGEFHDGSVRDNPSLIRMNNSACNKLYKLSLFEEVRFPKGKYYEDLACIPSVLYEAERIVKINEAFYYYRQRSGSIAHTANMHIFDIYDAIEDTMSYVKSHGYEQEIINEVKHMYILHGLDLTTLRIRDFDDKDIRVSYLKENMKRLRQAYPEYQQDSLYKEADIKKKLIWMLLKHGKEKMALRLYDR